MGLLRPDKDSKIRFLFNYAHRSIGIFTFVSASKTSFNHNKVCMVFILLKM